MIVLEMWLNDVMVQVNDPGYIPVVGMTIECAFGKVIVETVMPAYRPTGTIIVCKVKSADEPPPEEPLVLAIGDAVRVNPDRRGGLDIEAVYLIRETNLRVSTGEVYYKLVGVGGGFTRSLFIVVHRATEESLLQVIDYLDTDD